MTYPFIPVSQKYFFLCATKKKRLEGTAEGEQEPLLGGSTAPEPLPSFCLWFLNQQRAWRGHSPGLGSDACLMNHGCGRLLSGEGSVGQRPLQVTV